MAIELRCPNCEKSVRVKDELVGRTVKCPACDSAFRVASPPVVASGPSRPSDPGLDQFVRSLDAGSTPSGPTVPLDQPQKTGSGERPCPFCGEEIKASAIKCRFCGEFLKSALNQKAPDTVKVYKYDRPAYFMPIAILLAVFGVCSLPIGAVFLATSSMMLQPRKTGAIFAWTTFGFWAFGFIILPIVIMSIMASGNPEEREAIPGLICAMTFYAPLAAAMWMVAGSKRGSAFFKNNVTACPACGSDLKRLQRSFWPSRMTCKDCQALMEFTDLKKA